MNWIKRNPMLTIVLCVCAVVALQIGRVAASHAQKPEPKPTIAWSATNVNAGYVMFLAKDGTVMFSESGTVSDAKAVATNVHCDPEKPVKYDGWHGCKAIPFAAWIEQHCVAVLPKTPTGVINDLPKAWPEQRLKLRCDGK